MNRPLFKKKRVTRYTNLGVLIDREELAYWRRVAETEDTTMSEVIRYVLREAKVALPFFQKYDDKGNLITSDPFAE